MEELEHFLCATLFKALKGTGQLAAHQFHDQVCYILIILFTSEQIVCEDHKKSCNG